MRKMIQKTFKWKNTSFMIGVIYFPIYKRYTCQTINHCSSIMVWRSIWSLYHEKLWTNNINIIISCLNKSEKILSFDMWILFLLFQNSFSDIARVLSEFFRDLDVVPGDVVVGLVLLRQRQQLLRLRVVHQVT